KLKLKSELKSKSKSPEASKIESNRIEKSKSPEASKIESNRIEKSKKKKIPRLSKDDPCSSFVQRENYDRNFLSTYVWNQKLLKYSWAKSRDVNEPGFTTPPISTFKHAPLRKALEKITLEGIIVEIPNFDGFREVTFSSYQR